jgi:3-oxoacyl-(acyl-carrier-protein) synthase
MINITINHSIYSEEVTELTHLDKPQKVHQVTDGGMFVKKGIKVLPAVLIEKLLDSVEGLIDKLQDTFTSSGRNGFILSTGGSVWTGYAGIKHRTAEYPTLKILPMGMSQIYAGQLANSLGNFEHISTDATSCVSAHAALSQAKLLIKADELDRVVIISTDNATSEEFMQFFREQSLTRSLKEESISVNKFRLGQAANIILLENDKATKASGNTPVGLLHGVALVAEYNTNPLGIRDDGAGYKLAITKVLEGNTKTKINFIKLHDTMSTDNAVERIVVDKLYPGVRKISYKKRIGHTMGVSTAVEMGIAMKEEQGTFISLGAGMGNVFTAALVEIA